MRLRSMEPLFSPINSHAFQGLFLQWRVCDGLPGQLDLILTLSSPIFFIYLHQQTSETKNQPKDRSFRPDVPADIRPKLRSVPPNPGKKQKHFGMDMPRGRPRKQLRSENLRADFPFPKTWLTLNYFTSSISLQRHLNLQTINCWLYATQCPPQRKLFWIHFTCNGYLMPCSPSHIVVGHCRTWTPRTSFLVMYLAYILLGGDLSRAILTLKTFNYNTKSSKNFDNATKCYRNILYLLQFPKVCACNF